MQTPESRIPVTLLTGFLGAGKTTLLNHLLRDPEAGRIAVIMNEFGKAGLDHDLIEQPTEETILMQSGCLCCTFRGDISTTLGSLIERRNSGELSFDRVVIETTGIADPAPIMHTLVVDDAIAANYRMDGVVTVTDSATGSSTLDMHKEAVHQIAIADLIIITKTDLVSPDELATYKERIARLNASAKVIYSENGRVPTGTLIGLLPVQANASEDKIKRWIGTDSNPVVEQIELSDTDATQPEPLARHDRQITSTSIEVEHPIPPAVFDLWIDTLIAFKGPDLLRIKGIVHVEGAKYPFMFHGVQHIFNPPIPLKSWNKEDTTSRIAVIVRDMTNEDLKASLDLLSMRPQSASKDVSQPMEVPF